MSNEKQREAKESVYRQANLDVRSVCNGQFYKKSSKHTRSVRTALIASNTIAINRSQKIHPK